MVTTVVVGAAVALLSWLFVAAVRRYALTVSCSTCRISGMPGAIALGGAVVGPGYFGDWASILALLVVIPTAVVGWIDDRSSLTVGSWMAMHLLSALMILPLAIDAIIGLQALVF